MGGGVAACAAVLVVALIGAAGCGRPGVDAGAASGPRTASSPRVASTPPRAPSPTPHRPGKMSEIPCDPAAGDFKQRPTPLPSPCISIDPEQQIRDNLRYLDRQQPKPADVAALGPAAADLRQAFAGLRDRQAFDVASTKQAVAAYPSLGKAFVHAPLGERLTTEGATVVVVLEHGSACLIGEHGSTTSVAYVVGHTMDGACEAVYGH